jgi:hypothetical protein
MPCACGGAAKRREMLRTTYAEPTKDGGYLLMTYPGCTELYRGEFEGGSTYVVGRNTESERLFAWTELADATTWAIETSSMIENIPNVGLCAQAVTDVYASV